MTLQELNLLKKEIEADFTITEENAMVKSLDAPKIFSKYLARTIKESQVLKKMKGDLDKMYADRYKYYKEDYERKLNQGEIETYILTEAEYHKKNYEYQLQESICAFLEGITKKANNLSFDIKNFVDLRLFYGGGKSR